MLITLAIEPVVSDDDIPNVTGTIVPFLSVSVFIFARYALPTDEQSAGSTALI